MFNIDNFSVDGYKCAMDVDALHRHIGTVIKGRRKQLNMTQEQLANRMATSRAALANVETGRQNVLVHHLYSFAKHLDLRIEDLLPPIAGSTASEFPLPEGLNRIQRDQITRLLDDAPAVAAPLTEGSNVSYNKQRSKG